MWGQKYVRRYVTTSFPRSIYLQFIYIGQNIHLLRSVLHRSKNISKDKRTSYASAEHTYERHEMIKIIFPSIDASAEHLYEQHQKKIDNLRLS